MRFCKGLSRYTSHKSDLAAHIGEQIIADRILDRDPPLVAAHDQPPQDLPIRYRARPERHE